MNKYHNRKYTKSFFDISSLKNANSLFQSSVVTAMLRSLVSAALRLFPSQAVGGAAEAFQGLLRILGPEAALESIIRAVGLSQEP